MEMTPSQIRDAVEAFMKRAGMKPSRFGLDAVDDPNFVFNLRKGREPRQDTARRVMDFIDRREAEMEAAS